MNWPKTVIIAGMLIPIDSWDEFFEALEFAKWTKTLPLQLKLDLQ